ncbi:MAG: choline/carnitine/betaine transport [Cryomorphaceae bacterium]|jgi:choline/carnitine/betaine transport
MPKSDVSKNTHLSIETADSGFYQGFNKVVSITPKVLVIALIIWAGFFPESSGPALLTMQNWTTDVFGAWYMYVAALFMIATVLLAIIPKSAHTKLGLPDDTPEFSNFSWFSMMFGAGIGIGMLTYSTAEPIFHFVSNPDTILGFAEGSTAGNVRNAYKWAFLHYALTPWACYAVIGITLGYLSYNRGFPLTIRSSLQPLFGKAVSGPLGHIVDIVAILATIIGVGVTIGYGVSQFASGVFNITPAAWLMTDGKPSLAAQITALSIVLIASTISAMSGVDKGIKWLSNINMGLSFFLLIFFVFFGSLLFAAKIFGFAIYDYVTNLMQMSFTVWDAKEVAPSADLAAWQGSWTIFYWAWWIAFAPFVGLFLARVSRGRTIREYVIGAMVIPSITCLTWFTLIGGTAIDLELSGIANGSIVNSDISAQLYQTINLILSSPFAAAMSVVIVILLLTYLITSVDSAILIVTTLASGGNQAQKHARHIVIWGVLFMAVIASLLAAGGLDALRSAMIIGALPFSFVMVLMLISLVKVLFFSKD